MKFSEMKLQAEMFAAQARPLLVAKGQNAQQLIVAGMIVGALAVEVALKACIVRNHGFTKPTDLANLLKGKGHDTEYLISLLTGPEKAAIQAHLDAYVPESARQMVRYDGPGWPLSLRARTIGEELKNLGKVFEHWRYAYEHNPLIGNPDFVLLAISATLDALALDQV